MSLESSQSKPNTDCEDSNLEPGLSAITTEISLSDSNEAFEFPENADSSDTDSLNKLIKRRKLSSDNLDSDSQPGNWFCLKVYLAHRFFFLIQNYNFSVSIADAELLLSRLKSAEGSGDKVKEHILHSDVRKDKTDLELKCDMKLKLSEVDSQVTSTRLKRSHENDSEEVEGKKIRIDSDEKPRQISLPEERHKLKELSNVKKFFERDVQGELKKLTQEVS